MEGVLAPLHVVPGPDGTVTARVQHPHKDAGCACSQGQVGGRGPGGGLDGVVLHGQVVAEGPL